MIAGCGYVGTELGCQLGRAGYQVYGVRRSAAGLPSPIEPIAADLTDEASLIRLPPALDQVVYAASPGASHDEAYRKAYVAGLENLLRAPSLAAAPPRRVLFVGSTAVYEQNTGEWVDEQSPTRPEHFSGKRLLEAEAVLRDSGLDTITLRCGGIYGPGRTGLFDRVRRGEATYEIGPPRYTNRIHRDDLVGALRHLLTLSSPHAAYLGVDNDPAERRVVLEWLAERLGAPRPRGVDSPSETGRARRSNKRCDNARLVDSGYRFTYPTFREGYAALIGDSRD